MSKQLINGKVIAHVVGSLIIINGILMSLAIPFSLYYGDDVHWSFLISCGITLSFGLFLRFNTLANKNDEIKKREGFLIVTLGWLSLAIFGCLPYLISGAIPSIHDAFFETMSGFTTTGASILGSEGSKISDMPHSILFWRSMTHWIGGMGIIVLTIAILPLLGIGGMELFVAEAPGPTKDKIHPRIKETAKRLWIIYLALTIIQTLLLMIFDMTFFDAINHSFATVSTGGFSTRDGSIAEFNSPIIEYIIILFMFISGTNFTLIYFGLKRKFFRIWENDEFKWYGLSLLGLTALLLPIVYSTSGATEIEPTFRAVLFQLTSIMTTTGFSTSDFLLWGPLVSFIFFLLLFSGASAGSTSGGIKIVRVVILLKNTLMEFKRRLHPKAVIPVHLNKQPVSNTIIYNLMAFIFLYLFIFTLGSVVLTALGVPFDESISGVATSLGNVGPGLGALGPMGNFSILPDAAKWVLSILMLMGRLELFTVILILSPYFWRRN